MATNHSLPTAADYIKAEEMFREITDIYQDLFSSAENRTCFEDPVFKQRLKEYLAREIVEMRKNKINKNSPKTDSITDNAIYKSDIPDVL